MSEKKEIDVTWKTAAPDDVAGVWHRLSNIGGNIPESLPVGSIVIRVQSSKGSEKKFTFTKVVSHLPSPDKASGYGYAQQEVLRNTGGKYTRRMGKSVVAYASLKSSGSYRVWARPGEPSPLRWGTKAAGFKTPEEVATPASDTAPTPEQVHATKVMLSKVIGEQNGLLSIQTGLLNDLLKAVRENTTELRALRAYWEGEAK